MHQFAMAAPPPMPLQWSTSYSAGSTSPTSPASPISPSGQPYATSYMSPGHNAGRVPFSVANGTQQLVFGGNSAANALHSSDSAFRRIEELNHTAEKLYKVARVAPASLFRKDNLKWNSTGGFFHSPKVCDDPSVNERSTMQLLADMEVTLDTVIAELSMVNKTLTTNVQFMTQFFVCCNRIIALIEVMRSWSPRHGMWEVLVASGPFNNQSKLAAMAEVVESKIKGKVQAHFSLDMRATGAATTDVLGGGTTTIDLSSHNVVTSASSLVQMNQGVTSGFTAIGADPLKPQQSYTFAPPPVPVRPMSYLVQSSLTQPYSSSSTTTTTAYYPATPHADDPYASYGSGIEGARL